MMMQNLARKRFSNFKRNKLSSSYLHRYCGGCLAKNNQGLELAAKRSLKFSLNIMSPTLKKRYITFSEFVFARVGPVVQSVVRNRYLHRNNQFQWKWSNEFIRKIVGFRKYTFEFRSSFKGRNKQKILQTHQPSTTTSTFFARFVDKPVFLGFFNINSPMALPIFWANREASSTSVAQTFKLRSICPRTTNFYSRYINRILKSVDSEGKGVSPELFNRNSLFAFPVFPTTKQTISKPGSRAFKPKPLYRKNTSRNLTYINRISKLEDSAGKGVFPGWLNRNALLVARVGPASKHTTMVPGAPMLNAESLYHSNIDSPSTTRNEILENDLHLSLQKRFNRSVPSVNQRFGSERTNHNLRVGKNDKTRRRPIFDVFNRPQRIEANSSLTPSKSLFFSKIGRGGTESIDIARKNRVYKHEKEFPIVLQTRSKNIFDANYIHIKKISTKDGKNFSTIFGQKFRHFFLQDSENSQSLAKSESKIVKVKNDVDESTMLFENARTIPLVHTTPYSASRVTDNELSSNAHRTGPGDHHLLTDPNTTNQFNAVKIGIPLAPPIGIKAQSDDSMFSPNTIRELTEKVYVMFEDKLKTERERRGIFL